MKVQILALALTTASAASAVSFLEQPRHEFNEEQFKLEVEAKFEYLLHKFYENKHSIFDSLITLRERLQGARKQGWGSYLHGLVWPRRRLSLEDLGSALADVVERTFNEDYSGSGTKITSFGGYIDGVKGVLCTGTAPKDSAVSDLAGLADELGWTTGFDLFGLRVSVSVSELNGLVKTLLACPCDVGR